jgi:hypothetical protein
MIDYAKILTIKYSGEEWTMDGDEYSGLTWLSDSPKPTKAILDGFWSTVQAEILAENEANMAAKTALLDRLGITEAEAKLLLS